MRPLAALPDQNVSDRQAYCAEPVQSGVDGREIRKRHEPLSFKSSLTTLRISSTERPSVPSKETARKRPLRSTTTKRVLWMNISSRFVDAFSCTASLRP